MTQIRKNRSHISFTAALRAHTPSKSVEMLFYSLCTLRTVRPIFLSSTTREAATTDNFLLINCTRWPSNFGTNFKEIAKSHSCLLATPTRFYHASDEKERNSTQKKNLRSTNNNNDERRSKATWVEPVCCRKLTFVWRDQLCISCRKAERGRMRPPRHMGLIPGEQVGVYFLDTIYCAFCWPA